MRKEQEKIRTTATKQITEVLTAEQKTSFNKMQGKPFDLSSLRDGPGNGPRNSTRATRSAGRTKAQTKQRARRGTEPEPGMEFQPGMEFRARDGVSTRGRRPPMSRFDRRVDTMAGQRVG